MKQTQWLAHPLRVRYQETDQMGVVFHGHYVTWFEIGRTEWIRAKGMTYRTIEAKGFMLPVIDLEMKFHAPARYDDMVSIYTRVVRSSALRVTFESQIRKSATAVETNQGMQISGFPEPVCEPAGELLVSGRTHHVWLNREWRATRIDRELPELFAMLQQEQE